MFTVEKNIPVPEKGTRGVKGFIASLSTGDSFVVPSAKLAGVQGAASSLRAQGANIHLRARRLENGQHRVWVV